MVEIKKGNSFKKLLNRYFGVSIGNNIFHICNYLFFIIIAVVMFYPFLYVLKTSLTVNEFVNGIAVERINFKAYAIIMKNAGLVSSFLISVGVVAIYVVLHILITILAAYPLSRPQLKGKTGILLFIIFTMLFSGGLIPYYILIDNLNLFGNVAVYVVVGLVSPFNTIIAKNFIQGLPESLVESAKMDGANELTVLLKIVFPLCMPIVATIALWAGVGKWNDWMTGVLYMQSEKDLWMIQNFLRYILINTSSSGQGSVDSEVMAMADGVKMAAIVISVIPIIAVYPFVQKHFVKGMLLGSVKG